MKSLSFFLLSVFSSISLAQDLYPAPLLSQGGSGGASLKEDISYLINPATIGFQTQFKGVLLYSFKQKKQTAVLSFLDLKTQIPLALSYQRFWSDSFKKSEKDLLLFSSGFKISPHLSLGLAIEKKLKSPLWNMHLGSVLRWNPQLSLALFLNNFLEEQNKNERILSLAFHYDWKKFFSTHLDVSKTVHRGWILKGGVESFFHNFFSLRGGYVWFHDMRQGLISGGVVFHSPKFLLEYGLQTHQKTYQHIFSLILRV